MSEIRNKIITISGEPVSGKSTVVKSLKKKYEEKGFNVHIISVGQIFREAVKEEYAKLHPDKKDTNLADIQTDESFIEMRNKIDKMVDKELVAKKGEQINAKERPNDIYIIDSRLAWKNIPNSFAVRLTVDENIAGRRVFEDKSRGSEDEYKSIEEAAEKTKQRKLGEIERYKQRYGIDLTNPDNYNLIVDTSYSNTEELAELIVSGEELFREGKHCAKHWASPVHFMPLQLGRITGRPSDTGNTIESLAEDIRENGYHTSIDGVLEIIERDGVKFLLEGNHRVMAGLSAGKTLLPYIVTNRDNALVADRTLLLKYQKDYMEYLYDYADGLRYYGGKIGELKQFNDFSIDDLLHIDSVKEMMKSLGDTGR